MDDAVVVHEAVDDDLEICLQLVRRQVDSSQVVVVRDDALRHHLSRLVPKALVFEAEFVVSLVKLHLRHKALQLLVTPSWDAEVKALSLVQLDPNGVIDSNSSNSIADPLLKFELLDDRVLLARSELLLLDWLSDLDGMLVEDGPFALRGRVVVFLVHILDPRLLLLGLGGLKTPGSLSLHHSFDVWEECLLHLLVEVFDGVLPVPRLGEVLADSRLVRNVVPPALETAVSPLGSNADVAIRRVRLQHATRFGWRDDPGRLDGSSCLPSLLEGLLLDSIGHFVVMSAPVDQIENSHIVASGRVHRLSVVLAPHLRVDVIDLNYRWTQMLLVHLPLNCSLDLGEGLSGSKVKRRVLAMLLVEFNHGRGYFLLRLLALLLGLERKTRGSGSL